MFVDANSLLAAALTEEDVDLISFEASSAALNAPWGQPTPIANAVRPPAAVKFDSAEEFPTLGRPMVQKAYPRNIMDEDERLYRKESVELTNHPADAMRAHWETSGSRSRAQASSHFSAKKENISFGNASAASFTANRLLSQSQKLQPFSTYCAASAAVSSDNSAGVPRQSQELSAKRPKKTDVVAKRMVAHALGQRAPAAWGSQKNLFPDAPPAIAPPAALLQTMSLSSSKAETEPERTKLAKHDLSNPDFKTGDYWVSFTRKYKCPHIGCT